MMGLLVALFVIIAFFTGLYYITAGYSVATGFATITFAIIVAIGWFKYEDRIQTYIDELTGVDEPYEVFNDTVPAVENEEQPEVIVLEVHGTVYTAPDTVIIREEPMTHDSVVVEIVSEIPLTEAQIDSIADDMLFN